MAREGWGKCVAGAHELFCSNILMLYLRPHPHKICACIIVPALCWHRYHSRYDKGLECSPLSSILKIHAVACVKSECLGETALWLLRLCFFSRPHFQSVYKY